MSTRAFLIFLNYRKEQLYGRAMSLLTFKIRMLHRNGLVKTRRAVLLYIGIVNVVTAMLLFSTRARKQASNFGRDKFVVTPSVFVSRLSVSSLLYSLRACNRLLPAYNTLAFPVCTPPLVAARRIAVNTSRVPLLCCHSRGNCSRNDILSFLRGAFRAAISFVIRLRYRAKCPIKNLLQSGGAFARRLLQFKGTKPACDDNY